MMIRRKFVWLMMLMVWVGMVTSLVVYQGGEYFTSREASTDNVQIIEETGPDINLEEFDYSQVTEGQDNGDFFMEYRLERDRARSQQIELYREMINNPNTDEAAKKEAQQKMLELTEKMEKEMEIEGLIRARGYQDSLAYIHDRAVDIIINTRGLDKEDVARIGDIIVKATGVDFEDVTVIEKKGADE